MLKEELEVLAEKGFATAVKSECTSDSSEGKGSRNPAPHKNLANAKTPACCPEQAKDCGGKERRIKCSRKKQEKKGD